MAEPVWDFFVEITSSRSEIDFDFVKYNYRATTSSNFASSAYKNSTTTVSIVFQAPIGSYTDLFEDMTVYGQEYLTQGTNALFTSSTAYRIRVERSLKWTPPNLKLNINGATKEFDKGWVNINGELKEIDKMWTNINGELKEI